MPNIEAEETAGALVNNADLSSDGKFAFVEFRDEAICTLALTLFDKMEVCGRALNVGRPRGYIDPNGIAGAPTLGAPLGGLPLGAAAPGVGLPVPVSGGAVPPPPPPPQQPPTRTIKLDGMLSAEMLAADDEYNEVLDDIKTECEGVGGPVEAVVMPRTGPHACLCYVTFKEMSGAAKARESLDKRQFDGNTVKATFVQEMDVPTES